MYHPMMGAGSGRAAAMSFNALPHQAQEEVPFLIEPYKAFRIWQVEYQARKYPFLKSITYKIGWPRRRPARSHCLTQWRKQAQEQTGHFRHSAPDMLHKCGIYSLKDIDDTEHWMVGKSNVVIGSVLVWGKVFEYEKGYLSEYAYPLKVLAVGKSWDMDYRELLDSVLEGYGIESEI